MILYQCRVPYCTKTTPVRGGLCETHAGAGQEAPVTKASRPWGNAGRPNRELYDTTRWRELRSKVIEAQPYCAVCGSGSRLEVHHLEPPRGDEESFFDEEGLIVMCRTCHARETAREIRERKRL